MTSKKDGNAAKRFAMTGMSSKKLRDAALAFIQMKPKTLNFGRVKQFKMQRRELRKKRWPRSRLLLISTTSRLKKTREPKR